MLHAPFTVLIFNVADDEEDEDEQLDVHVGGNSSATDATVHPLALQKLRWPPNATDIVRYKKEYELTLQLFLLKMQGDHNLPGTDMFLLDTVCRCPHFSDESNGVRCCITRLSLASWDPSSTRNGCAPPCTANSRVTIFVVFRVI